MNSNTVESAQVSPGQGIYAIPLYKPSGTSATIVTNQLGNAAVISLNNGQATSANYGSGWDGGRFKVSIWGKVTTKASCNVTVAIACQTSTTYASGNLIATTGAIAVNTTSQNFFLEADCIWDSVTAAINGLLKGQVANTAVSQAALTNAVAVTGVTGLNFCPAVTFSDATAGTQMSITGFQIDIV